MAWGWQMDGKLSFCEDDLGALRDHKLELGQLSDLYQMERSLETASDEELPSGRWKAGEEHHLVLAGRTVREELGREVLVLPELPGAQH